MTFVPTKKEFDKSGFQKGLMNRLLLDHVDKRGKDRVVEGACERDYEEFLKRTEKTNEFLYNLVKDCICYRPKTLVQCLFCNYKTGEFAARVSKVCFQHPGLESLEFDLLRCPMCTYPNSLIEVQPVQAPRPKTSQPVLETSPQEETVVRKFFPVTLVRNKNCVCSRRNSPFACGNCDFRLASARVKKSCTVHPGVYKQGDITSCPGCGSPATES